VEKVAVVGAGNMGSGIVQKTAQEGLPVVMVDVNKEYIENAISKIRTTLQEAVKRKILEPERVDDIMGRIQGATNLYDVRDCDLVIEAVYEDMKLKKNLFKELDQICDKKTVLATNTSSFSVTEIARSTKRRDRFIGLHFFYHPAKNRLLEIIPGALTSSETISVAKTYSKLSGKTDILVKDSAGFAVNRFFVPWVNEATRLLEEGIANTATIEKAAMYLFGIGMGPFGLMNATGIPITYHAQSTLFENLGVFYKPSEILRAQFESGKPWTIEGHVEEDRIGMVWDRLLGSIFFTSTSLLDEKVTDIIGADVGAKVGLRWQKGPFEMINKVGISKAYTLVENLLKNWPDVDIPEILKIQSAKRKPWDIRYVRYSRDGDLGRICISRPDTLNALNQRVISQLDDAFAEAESDPRTKAIVLEATGKAFVAGADIKFFVDCIKENRLFDSYNFASYGHDVMNRIDECIKPVIAKVEGLALGSGFELVLATDLVFATPKSAMGFPETGIGIYPGLGGTQRAPRIVGKELAKYLIFTGRVISAADACSIGLVDYIVEPKEIDRKIHSVIDKLGTSGIKQKSLKEPSGDWKRIQELFTDDYIDDWLSGRYLEDEDPLAAKIAKTISKKAPLALKYVNKIIDRGFEKTLRAGLQDELAYLNEIFSTKDALTGLTNVGKIDIKYEGR
jgi:enoyl-CoA hydratase/3-hydroxyacyl-CoA dehydrogenase